MKKIITSFLLAVIVICNLFSVYAEETEELVSVFSGVSHDDVTKLDGVTHSGCIGAGASGGIATFENIDFGESGMEELEVYAAVEAAYAGQIINFYVDDTNNQPFAELTVQSTGGFSNYVWQKAKLNDGAIFGVHTVYVQLPGAGAGNVKEFKAKRVGSEGMIEIPESIVNEGLEKEYEILTLLDVIPTAQKIKYSEGERVEEIEAGEDISSEEFAAAALMLRGEQGTEAIERLHLECGSAKDEFITVEDALKMLIHILNRQVLLTDEQNYYDMASELGLKCDAKATSRLKWKDAIRLLYNTCDVAPLTLDSIAMGDGSYKDYYVIKEKNTLLLEYRKINRDKGILNMDSVTGLKKMSDIGDGYVLIDGYVFNIGKCNVSDLIGYEVEYYYTIGEYEDTLLYVKKSDNNKVTKINARDIEGYSNQYLKYYEGANEKNIKIPVGASIIKNGLAISKYDDNLLKNIKSGNVELISNNRDDTIDVIKVWDTVDKMAAGYSNGVIYFKNDDPINTESTTVKVNLMDKNSNPIEFEKLTENSVCTIASVVEMDSSVTVYNIWVNKNTTSGNISKVSKSDYVVSLDNKEYSLSESMTTEQMNMLITGIEIKGYLNKYNEIAFVESNAVSDMLGYVVKCYIDEDTDDVVVKIFDQNGEMANYICNKNIRIDGISPAGENGVYNALNARNELCVFTTNSMGKIREINFALDKATAELTGGNKTNGLYKYSDSLQGEYVRASSSVGGNAILADDFILFNIPSELSKYEDYTITQKSVFSNQQNIDIEAYNRNLGKLTIGIGVMTVNEASKAPPTSSDVNVVCDITEEWNDAISETEVIIEYYSTKTKEKMTSACHENSVTAAKQMKIGDGFICNMVDGKISGLSKTISIKDSSYVPQNNTSFYVATRYECGTVEKKQGNIIKLSGDTEYFNLKSASIFVCENGHVRVGTVSDILSSESVSTGCKVYMHLKYADVKTVIVEKN